MMQDEGVHAASRPSVFVLSSGHPTVALLRRIRRTGVDVSGVSEHPDVVLRECEEHRCSLLIALLEPGLFPRTLLSRCDELGVRVIGVVANSRHRDWAALLPLCETVWLYAPSRIYQQLLGGYREAPKLHIAD